MEYIAKYIFGSEDSIDIDTCYVVDRIPKNAKEVVDNIGEENANLIVIEKGIIVDCYKGTCDEMNNCLYDTYLNHKQEFPLLVTYRIERDIVLKDIRATRGILSYLSRTFYRPIIKDALRKGLEARLLILNSIDLNKVDFSCLNKKFNGESSLKVLAFQIGQAIGLHQGVEYYTKKQIAKDFPNLRKYLYRESIDPSDLQTQLIDYIDILKNSYKIKDLANRISVINGEYWDMKKEVRINKEDI